MRVFGREQPTPLPVQALDHATGYLMAAAVMRGLALRQAEQRASRWRLSLARTASLLIDAGAADSSRSSLDPDLEQTTWGPAQRVTAPLQIDGIELRWDRPARALGSDEPTW
jgi:crotonobetainyl-CoA:carnitine CoA-transferase CaiB-like acyl-CoA transferase